MNYRSDLSGATLRLRGRLEHRTPKGLPFREGVRAFFFADGPGAFSVQHVVWNSSVVVEAVVGC